VNGTRYIVAAWDGLISYFDMTDPLNPGQVQLASLTRNASQMFGFSWGNKPYLAMTDHLEDGDGVAVYDVSEWPSVNLVFFKSVDAYDMFFRQGKIYVLSRSQGLRIYDFSSGALLGSYTGADTSQANHVWVDGQYVYLALGQCLMTGGFDVVDPSTMTSILPPDFVPKNCYVGENDWDMWSSTYGGVTYFYSSNVYAVDVYKIDNCTPSARIVVTDFTPSAVDPGAVYSFQVTLKNTGSLGATGVSATLSTTRSDVTVSGNPQTYGAIGAGLSVTRSYTVTVAGGAAPGAVPFHLAITSSDGDFAADFSGSINEAHYTLVRSTTAVNGLTDKRVLITYTNTGNADFSGTLRVDLDTTTKGVAFLVNNDSFTGTIPANGGSMPEPLEYPFVLGETCVPFSFLSLTGVKETPSVSTAPKDYNVSFTPGGLYPYLTITGSTFKKQASGQYKLSLVLKNGPDADATVVSAEVTATLPSWSQTVTMPYDTILKNGSKSGDFLFDIPTGSTGDVTFTVELSSDGGAKGCWSPPAFTKDLADLQFQYVGDRHCGCGGKCLPSDPPTQIMENGCQLFYVKLEDTGASDASGVPATLIDLNGDTDVFIETANAAYTMAAGAQAENSPAFRVQLYDTYCSGGDETCPQLRLRLSIPEYNFTKDLTYTVKSETTPPDKCSLAYLASSLQITSDTGSNGQANPGDDVQFTIAIKNNSGVEAPNVKGQLSAPPDYSSYVTVQAPATVSFGTIPSSQSKRNDAQPYKFRLSGDAPTGTFYYFPLKITSDCDAAGFDAQVPIYVYAVQEPVTLAYDHTEVDDSATGDNDGGWEPGEAVSLRVFMTNTSSTVLRNASATLTSSDATITAQGMYITILPGGTASASFSASLPSSYGRSSAHFTISVVGATVSNPAFDVPVGAGVEAPLAYLGAGVDDADDIWRPGETVDLYVSLRNDGAGPFQNAAAVLTPLAGLITVVANGTYSAEAGATANVWFQAALSPNYKAETAPFRISVTGATAILPSDTFTVPVDVTGGTIRSLVIPVVAHATGAVGSNWKTDVTLLNATETAMTCTLKLIKSLKENPTPPQYPVVLNAGRQVVLRDILDLDSMPDFQGNDKASLLIEYTGSTPPAVSARIYNDLGTSGTYGQSVPCVRVDGQSRGTSGAIPSRLFGLRKTDAYRANLGVVNITGGWNQIRLTLYDPNGAQIAAPLPYTLAPYNMIQADDILKIVTGDAGQRSEAFSAKVESLSDPKLDFVAYASIVDNTTNDASFISDQIQAYAAALIPGAAHAVGANNTNWKTDVSVYNPSSEAMVVHVQYFRYGTDGFNIGYNLPSLPPNGTAIIPDILAAFSGLTADEKGYLVAGAVGGGIGLPLCSARTYNDQGTQGTYGQYIPSLNLAAGGAKAGHSMYYGGLTSNADYRMNFGLVNGDGEGPASATVTVRDASGIVLGTHQYWLGLPAMGTQIQQGQLMEDLNITQSFENATMEVVVGGESLFTYISSVDNHTDDPILLLPQIR